MEARVNKDQTVIKPPRRRPPPNGSTPLGKLRQAALLTQWEAAERVGVNRSTVCSWEYGRTGITPEHARMLAELYHTTAEEISRLVREARERYERY